MPDRPSEFAHVHFAFFYASSATLRLGLPFSAAIKDYASALGAVDGESQRFVPRQQARTHWGAATGSAMSRTLVWVDNEGFRGFGCSECGWRFLPSGSPASRSFDELMRNFELQRDKEFTSHVCAEHPKGD